MMSIFEYAYFTAKTATTASGAGGNTTVNLRPASGERWIVAWAAGYHDDAAGRDAIWYIVGSPDGTVELSRKTALAANTVLELYGANEAALNHWYRLPIVASYDIYPQFYVSAAAAAKNVYIRALIYRLRGTGEWGNT